MDSSASIALARASLARAIATEDEHAHAWSLLTIGYHNMRYVAPADGLALLESLRQIFDKMGDRRGLIVSTVGIACWGKIKNRPRGCRRPSRGLEIINNLLNKL